MISYIEQMSRAVPRWDAALGASAPDQTNLKGKINPLAGTGPPAGMSYFLNEHLSLTLDCGRIEDDRETDTAALENAFELMRRLVKAVGERSTSRLALQTIAAIAGLAAEGEILSISWREPGLFNCFAPLAEGIWREIAGPAAAVTHLLDGEAVIPAEQTPGSFGSGAWGGGVFGGTPIHSMGVK
jgi:hypothetical protein